MMLKKSKVAVLMNSYARDWLLERAIKSVLGQTFKNFTLYIIDDNSIKKNRLTITIINKFAKSDKRIIPIYRKTNDKDRRQKSTFCEGINKVLEQIKSDRSIHEYITYITCDGFFYPQRLQVMVQFLNKNKRFNNVYCPIQRAILHRHRIILCRDKIPNRIIEIVAPACKIDHESVMHRMPLLYKMKYPYWPERKVHEFSTPDGIFFTKLAKVGGPFVPVRQIMGIKLCHKDSIQGRYFGSTWPLLRP